MVKKGSKWKCIKSYNIGYFNDHVLFIHGKIYNSETDGKLTAENNRKIELYEDFLNEHFLIMEDKPERGEIRHHEFPKKGVKESQGKLTYELDFEFITQMAERMDANKGKYEPYNWQKPIDTAGLHRALARHFFQVMRANYEDEGREFGHLEALALNAMMINYQLKNHRDDTELEAKTDRNMNLISAFADHYEVETGKQIPESIILSFFNA